MLASTTFTSFGEVPATSTTSSTASTGMPGSFCMQTHATWSIHRLNFVQRTSSRATCWNNWNTSGSSLAGTLVGHLFHSTTQNSSCTWSFWSSSSLFPQSWSRCVSVQFEIVLLGSYGTQTSSETVIGETVIDHVDSSPHVFWETALACVPCSEDHFPVQLQLLIHCLAIVQDLLQMLTSKCPVCTYSSCVGLRLLGDFHLVILLSTAIWSLQQLNDSWEVKSTKSLQNDICHSTDWVPFILPERGDLLKVISFPISRVPNKLGCGSTPDSGPEWCRSSKFRSGPADICSFCAKWRRISSWNIQPSHACPMQVSSSDSAQSLRVPRGTLG